MSIKCTDIMSTCFVDTVDGSVDINHRRINKNVDIMHRHNVDVFVDTVDGSVEVSFSTSTCMSTCYIMSTESCRQICRLKPLTDKQKRRYNAPA